MKFEIESSKLELKRYLILGSERSVYHVGNRVNEEKFRPKALMSIDKLVALGASKAVSEVMKEAAKYEDSDPALLAYATAICVKSGNEALKRGVYSVIPEVLSTSEALFLHFKFVKDLSESGKLGGWGAGCRKAVAKWYMSKEKNLAETLYREAHHYGFSHRDILFLAHFKAPTPVIQATINHFAFGKEAPLPTLPEELQKLSADLQELKTSKDALKIAYLLSHLKLDDNYIPSDLYKSPEMWLEYIREMPTLKLLSKLELFSSSKKLSAVVLPQVVALLNDCDGSGIDPGHLYVAFKRYHVLFNFKRRENAIAKRRTAALVEDSIKELAIVDKKAEAKKLKSKVKKVGPKVNQDVIGALTHLLHRSIKKLKRGNTRWIVGLECLTGGSVQTLTWLQGVGVLNAGALVLLYLHHVATVQAVVSKGKGDDIKLEDTDEVETVNGKLRGLATEINQFSYAIKKATEDQTVVDAFLLLSDVVGSKWNEALPEAVESLNEYRKKLDRPHTRLVVLLLRQDRDLTVPKDSGILVMHGFDAKIPKLIADFGTGLF